LVSQIKSRKTLLKTAGFTLIEVMIAVAILAILAAVALPAYQDYSKGAKFTEVIVATQPYKLALEQVIHTGACFNSVQFGDLNHGVCGIPPAITTPVGYIKSLTVVDGVIQATAIPSLDDSTYVLTPDSTTPPVQWTVSGTCFTNHIC
jgi:prepilin-type N-terminal cleavage/methylation domain-containing protein